VAADGHALGAIVTKRHTLARGQDLISVAALYGVDPEQIWSHTENDELRKQRKKPNRIAVGDVVVVPDSAPKEVGRATGERHVFRRKGAQRERYIAYEVRDSNDLPVEGAYVLEYPDGRTESGTLEEGKLEREAVPPGRYALHLSRLEAWWSPSEVELGDPVELVVAHKALEARALKISVADELLVLAEEAPSFERIVALTVAHDPGAIVETRVACDLGFLDGLVPGDEARLHARIEADGHHAITDEPLRVRRTAPPAKANGFVAFELLANGAPVDSHYTLRLSDGTIRSHVSDGGVVREANVPPGDHALYLPELMGLSWTEESLDLEPSAASAKLGAVLLHRAVPDGQAVKLTVRHAHDGDDAPPLVEKTVTLRVRAAQLTETAETELRLALEGLDGLATGDRWGLTLTAECDGLVATTRRALLVHRVPKARERLPFVSFELRDPSGGPIDTEVLLIDPAGSCRRVKSEGGRLRHEGVAEGEHVLVVPSLARLRPTRRRWRIDRAPIRIPLELWHQGLRAGGRTTLTLHYEGLELDGETALARRQVPLPVDESRPAMQRAPMSIELTLPELPPGESCCVVAKAEHDGLWVCSPPMKLRRARDR
jgi:hypothetical protein